MRKHSMTAILSKLDREAKRLQRIAWAEQDARLHAIQEEREASETEAAKLLD